MLSSSWYFHIVDVLVYTKGQLMAIGNLNDRSHNLILPRVPISKLYIFPSISSPFY